MNQGELIYKDLSYQVCGFLFYIHNKLGRFCREKNYADALEIVLKENEIPFTREEIVPADVLSKKMNLYRTDFIVDNKLVIEMKAKDLLTRDDYFQVFNYLKIKNIKLGLLVNFRNKFLKPKRILNSLVNSHYT